MKTLTEFEYQNLEAILLTETPSSLEDEIAVLIEDQIDGKCSCRRDKIGNTYLSLQGGKEASVMIAAHADEIGLQVISITEDGYIRFRTVGGVDINATAGRQVHILNENHKIDGVICKAPIHIDYKERNEKRLDFFDLWIDIGCSNAEEANSLISIGDMISFTPNIIRLKGNKVSSKALDNKLGVFIAASALRRLADCTIDKNVTAVFTAQEEVGAKGAAVAAEQLKPTYGICIDVGVATDCPGIQTDKYGALILGDGPALVYCADTSRVLTDRAASILKAACIPFQKSVGLSFTGGTDTMRIQMAATGIPCILISIPLRSMHTPTEVCDLNDVASAIDCVVEIIKLL